MNQIQMRSTLAIDDASKANKKLSHLYLFAFVAACIFYWWLPSFYYVVVLNRPDPVSEWSLCVSFLAFSFYLVGYMFAAHPKGNITISPKITNGCEWLSGGLTKFLFLPSLIYAIYFFAYHRHEYYGGIFIPSLASGLLYLHLSAGCMYLSVMRTEKHSKYEVWIAILLVILPRFIICMNYYRLFIVFAVAPIVFIAVARNWIRLTARRAIALALLGSCLVVIPATLRGDFNGYSNGIVGGNLRTFFGSWLLQGSTLIVFDKFHGFDLSGMCPPLLVSLTSQVFPYKTLGVCTVPWGADTRVADSGAVATYMQDGYNFTRTGSASTFILDLYWLGGISAIIIGSIVMGYTCRLFVEAMGKRSVFNWIWAECLVRSLFAILNSYGEIFQRIPGSLLATFLCILVVSSALRSKSL